MKKTKSAKIKRAETIISKIVDLQYVNSGFDPYLQDAARSIRKYIENLK